MQVVGQPIRIQTTQETCTKVHTKHMANTLAKPAKKHAAKRQADMRNITEQPHSTYKVAVKIGSGILVNQKKKSYTLEVQTQLQRVYFLNLKSIHQKIYLDQSTMKQS